MKQLKAMQKRKAHNITDNNKYKMRRGHLPIMLSLYLQHRASFGWQVLINTSNLHKVELQQRKCKSKNLVFLTTV